MHIKTHKVEVFSEPCSLELMHFDDTDRVKWKQLFDQWKSLKMGMREYKSREPNFPEGLSEVAFCLHSGSGRFIKLKGNSKASFDTFDLQDNRSEQIKACSVEYDLTSFGPKSVWDDIYFLDFFNEGLLDGRFDIYQIPTGLILNMKVNKDQTVADQQNQGRRPRFSIKRKIIKELNIKPIATKVTVWKKD